MEYQAGAVRPIGSIEDGWRIIKDDYWMFFAMTLVAAAITAAAFLVLQLISNVAAVGVSAVLGATTSGAGDAVKISAAILPQIITAVVSLFTNLLLGVISGAFFCGMYTALARKLTTGRVEFSDLFAGFQKLLPCLIVATVLSVVQFAVSLVTLLGGAAIGISVVGAGILTKDGRFNPAIFGGLFLVLLAFVAISVAVNLIVSALTTFSYPLIAERDLSGGGALLLAVKGGFANVGRLILLLLMLGLITFAGMIPCFLGIPFVLPIIIAALFAAYQSVFGRTGNANWQTQAPPPPPVFGNQPRY